MRQILVPFKRLLRQLSVALLVLVSSSSSSSSSSFVSSRVFGNGSKIQLAIFVALLLNVDSPRPILAWLRHFYLIPAQAPFCSQASAEVVIKFLIS